jgi:DNA-binding transcriptional MocR family regulator
MHTERRIVIDAASIEIRRRVGPTAWAVFEELALSSTGPRDACTASVSVRSLADRLGMSKDTVARALSRLRAAGLVSARQARGSAGTFAVGSYRLHLPESVALVASAANAAPSRAPGRARAAASAAQLALAIES